MIKEWRSWWTNRNWSRAGGGARVRAVNPMIKQWQHQATTCPPWGPPQHTYLGKETRPTSAQFQFHSRPNWTHMGLYRPTVRHQGYTLNPFTNLETPLLLHHATATCHCPTPTFHIYPIEADISWTPHGRPPTSPVHVAHILLASASNYSAPCPSPAFLLSSFSLLTSNSP